MSLLISVHQLCKSHGHHQLFKDLSFGIHENEKIGLLGPNGAGKSTLLKILASLQEADSGEVSPRKNLKIGYVSQQDHFDENATLIKIVEDELLKMGLPQDEASIQASVHLSMAQFADFEITPQSLSGGWKKRLNLAIAFAKDPDLLLMDEPTNHMDWEGIFWLESQLQTFNKSYLVVSHDRQFLKNKCHRFMEISRSYETGYLARDCDYETFLKEKENHLSSQQEKQASMANKARRELEWLRAGVKARTTKSQSRAKEAHQLMKDLESLKQRNSMAQNKVKIEIESGGKRSKKLVATKDLDIFYGDKTVLKKMTMELGPGHCLGLVGHNASGKTSLLKVLAKEADNYRGDLFHADELKIVYFDQKKEKLREDQSLMEYLGDGSDFVPFKGRSIHVASYASFFLFDSQKLNFPIERLSGGEKARLLIAKLLLQPADLLILDEPTNDLDINTIEILEERLLEFQGLSLLVSHDRYFLERLAHRFLGLDGKGHWQFYADLNQWLSHQNKSEPGTHSKNKSQSTKKAAKPKLKLSYKEKRKLETIEADIERAENEVMKAQEALDACQDFSDHNKLQSLLEDLQARQKTVEELYLFWDDIEKRKNDLS